MLRDRKFDDVAVADLAFLRDRMKLPNEQLAEALYERCVRIERKYGNLMLQTDGAPPLGAAPLLPLVSPRASLKAAHR